MDDPFKFWRYSYLHSTYIISLYPAPAQTTANPPTGVPHRGEIGPMLVKAWPYIGVKYYASSVSLLLKASVTWTRSVWLVRTNLLSKEGDSFCISTRVLRLATWSMCLLMSVEITCNVICVHLVQWRNGGVVMQPLYIIIIIIIRDVPSTQDIRAARDRKCSNVIYELQYFRIIKQ